MHVPIMRNPLTMLLALVIFVAPALNAQQPAPQVGQSTSSSIPEAFLIGGALFLSVMLDSEIRDGIQDARGGFTNGVADVGNTFGSLRVVIPALGAAWLGTKAIKNDAASGVVGRAVLSVGLVGPIVFGLKALVGRIRPGDGGIPDSFRPFRTKDASFPSGHTAMAFSLATSFARETPDHASDVVFYSLATLTGYARMNDERHWFSDVVAGAFIGYLSARVVGSSKNGLSVGATPAGMGLRFEF